MIETQLERIHRRIAKDAAAADEVLGIAKQLPTGKRVLALLAGDAMAADASLALSYCNEQCPRLVTSESPNGGMSGAFKNRLAMLRSSVAPK